MRYFMTEVRAGDWGRSLRWYRDVLGLRVVLEDAAGRFALLEAGPGGGRVAIKGQDPADRPGRGAVRLVFEVEGLDGWLDDLRGRGVPFEGPRASAEGYREVTLADPDGTPIGAFEWT